MPKYITIIFLFCACLLQAQNFNIAERYGLFNLTFNGVEVVNNNYYFCGYGQDSTLPNKVNLYLLKTKLNGEKVFLKSYSDTSGNWIFSMPNGIEKKNEGFIIRAQVEGTGDNNFISLLIADTNGNISKPILFKEDSFLTSFGRDIVINPNGGYYLIGGIQRQNFEVDVQIFKLDNNFQTIWRRFYGINQKREQPYSAAQLANGNIVVGAHRYDANRVSGTRYKEQTWIFEIDTAGNMVRQFLDSDTRTGPAKGITQTPDGGFVYCGSYQTVWNGNAGYTHKPSISKVNSSLDIKDWEVIFKDTIGGDQSFEKIVEHKNSYIAIGTMFTEYPNDWGLIWGGALVKFDDLGNVSWSKGITSSDSIDNKNYHYFYDGILDENGNIICAGQVEQLSGPNLGWIVKLDSNGCLTPSNCGYPALNVQEFASTEKELTVYPNPFTTFLNIEGDEEIKKVEIYDVFGKLVHKENILKNTLQLGNLPKGFYLIKCNTDKNVQFIKKIVKY